MDLLLNVVVIAIGCIVAAMGLFEDGYMSQAPRLRPDGTRRPLEGVRRLFRGVTAAGWIMIGFTLGGVVLGVVKYRRDEAAKTTQAAQWQARMDAAEQTARERQAELTDKMIVCHNEQAAALGQLQKLQQSAGDIVAAVQDTTTIDGRRLSITRDALEQQIRESHKILVGQGESLNEKVLFQIKEMHEKHVAPLHNQVTAELIPRVAALPTLVQLAEQCASVEEIKRTCATPDQVRCPATPACPACPSGPSLADIEAKVSAYCRPSATSVSNPIVPPPTTEGGATQAAN